MTDKITLSLPEQFRQFAPTVWPSVAESARADGYHWIAEQIREQTKAPVEEPTEWGSLVRARRSPGVPLTLLTYVPEPDDVRDSRYSWYSDQDSWHIWSDLSDIEVLRVGVGEAVPLADEVVRSTLRLAEIRMFGTVDGGLLSDESELPVGELRRLLWTAVVPEPTPEQVEAASAPGVPDAIEALVQECYSRADNGGYGAVLGIDEIRDLTARVIEVGGQQPGMPTLESLIKTIDKAGSLEVGGTLWPLDRKNVREIADAVLALLPKEPTS